MLNWLSSSGESAPLTGNASGASSTVTEAVSDVSIYVGDKAQEAAESLKRHLPFISCFTPLHMRHRLIGGGEPEPPKSFVENLTEELSLSRTNRLIGFATCLAMGFFFNFLAVSVFLVIPRKFAIAFTLGNMMSIGSTMFLMGPWAQIKKMCSPERAPATTVYFVSMFCTLYCALALRSFILTIPCVIIQLCALIYYGESNHFAFFSLLTVRPGITFIPFGHSIFMGFMKRIFSCCFSSSS